jgi:membrane protein DedA with SNARE-associated domain/rhodanese-related sulfurtransferase
MQLLQTLLADYGLWLVFANVLAVRLGLPVPAYPTLIAVGTIAGRGDVGVLEVVATATAASLIADSAWYAGGARHGRRVLRLMCRLSLAPDSCVRRTEDIYVRWGAPSLMIARFIPGYTTLATTMAGLVRTPFWKFALYDAVGVVLWSGLAVALGWLFRDAVGALLAAFQQGGRWGLAVLLLALGLYVAVRALQRQRLIRALRMARVGVDELHRMLADRERVLIVDVRSLTSQNEGRIPGALWVDSDAFEKSLQAHGLSERTGEEVVVYCACPNEASAAVVARKLMAAGFTRVRPLAGGIDAWIEKGYRVEVLE